MSKTIYTPVKPYFLFTGRFPYEGPVSDNPLAVKAYDDDRIVGGKSMRDHLRFAVRYWHNFCWEGNDPFCVGTRGNPQNGKRFDDGELNLADLREIAHRSAEPVRRSGKQERIENLINDFIIKACRSLSGRFW